jgi:hypothetical protein
MTQASAILMGLFREAWVALASALLVFVLLAALAQVLRVSTASMIGASYWVWDAASAGVALLLLALFAFLGVPMIVQAAQTAVPPGGGCGPIAELGALAARLIAAFAALRIIKAFVTSATATAMGGSTSLSHALLEAGEAVLGMVLASAAIPIGAQFLGVC